MPIFGAHSVAPYPKVGAKEVAHHGALAGYDGREDVGAPVASAEEIVGAEPQHSRVDKGADTPACHKFKILQDHVEYGLSWGSKKKCVYVSPTLLVCRALRGL